MITLGLDRTAERGVSNYPFVNSWNRSLNDVTLPAAGIYALQVYVEPSMQPPIHISTIQQLGDQVELTLADANNRAIGTAVFNRASQPTRIGAYDVVSRQILRNGVITAGMITCSPSFIEALFAQCASSSVAITLASNAAVLLPECLLPVNRSGVMCISVNGMRTDTGVTLQTDVDACTIMTQSPISFSVYETQEHLEQRVDLQTSDSMGITNVYVGGSSYDCAGKHLILQHAALSDLRVETIAGVVELKGVLDD